MSAHTIRRTPRSIPLRTAEEARQWLRTNGVSASQFARDNGLSLDAVKEVLNGRSKANFGKAHDAAVALGIKRSPEITTMPHKITRQR